MNCLCSCYFCYTRLFFLIATNADSSKRIFCFIFDAHYSFTMKNSPSSRSIRTDVGHRRHGGRCAHSPHNRRRRQRQAPPNRAAIPVRLLFSVGLRCRRCCLVNTENASPQARTIATNALRSTSRSLAPRTGVAYVPLSFFFALVFHFSVFALLICQRAQCCDGCAKYQPTCRNQGWCSTVVNPMFRHKSAQARI